jgi:hypothetical protein
MTGWPPLPNATLTQVNAAGSSADYDRDPTVGALKWSGAADAVWAEQEERIAGAAGVNLMVHRSVVVAEALGIDWADGDVLVVTTTEGTQTGTAQRVKRVDAAPDVPGSVRVVLDDA